MRFPSCDNLLSTLGNKQIEGLRYYKRRRLGKSCGIVNVSVFSSSKTHPQNNPTDVLHVLLATYA